jgi:hypothetical protein
LVLKCLSYLLWHWNLSTTFLYGTQGIYRMRGFVPRRYCPSCLQFYPRLGSGTFRTFPTICWACKRNSYRSYRLYIQLMILRRLKYESLSCWYLSQVLLRMRLLLRIGNKKYFISAGNIIRISDKNCIHIWIITRLQIFFN